MHFANPGSWASLHFVAGFLWRSLKLVWSEILRNSSLFSVRIPQSILEHHHPHFLKLLLVTLSLAQSENSHLLEHQFEIRKSLVQSVLQLLTHTSGTYYIIFTRHRITCFNDISSNRLPSSTHILFMLSLRILIFYSSPIFPSTFIFMFSVCFFLRKCTYYRTFSKI